MKECPDCGFRLKFSGYIKPQSLNKQLKVYYCKVCGWRGL